MLSRILMNESEVERQKYVSLEIKDYYLLVIIMIMKCVVFQKRNECSQEAHRSKARRTLNFLLEILSS